MTPSFISAVNAARDRMVKADINVLSYIMQSSNADYYIPEGIRAEVAKSLNIHMDGDFHDLFDQVVQSYLKPFEWRAMGLPELCQSYLNMKDCEAKRMLKQRIKNQFGSHYNQVQIEWVDGLKCIRITLAQGTQTLNEIKIWL